MNEIPIRILQVRPADFKQIDLMYGHMVDITYDYQPHDPKTTDVGLLIEGVHPTKTVLYSRIDKSYYLILSFSHLRDESNNIYRAECHPLWENGVETHCQHKSLPPVLNWIRTIESTHAE